MTLALKTGFMSRAMKPRSPVASSTASATLPVLALPNVSMISAGVGAAASGAGAGAGRLGRRRGEGRQAEDGRRQATMSGKRFSCSFGTSLREPPEAYHPQDVVARKFGADGRGGVVPCASLASMANDEGEPQDIPDADLEQWYRVHNGRDMDGRPAGIGIQARTGSSGASSMRVRKLRGA